VGPRVRSRSATLAERYAMTWVMRMVIGYWQDSSAAVRTRRSNMQVADLMSQDVSCCSTNDSLSVPARLMWDCDCGAVPVLNAQTGSVVGMITDRDICMAT